MVRKQWELKKGQAERKSQALALAGEWGLPPFAVLLALGRGMPEEEIPGFFGLEDEAALTNPYELPDMELAVERIEQALENGEHITVFGDYDCDGVTATALLYQYLSGISESASYYLPDRHTEGYGLNMAAADLLAERGTKLIVTVDNGVSALREIEHAKALGMDVVVTDHHQIGDNLPKAAANVNPRREEFELGFREFTGVGIAFLLVCALEGREPEELLPEYASLVALGTVADVASLRGDNRIFVREGLTQLGQNPGMGLTALLRMARVTRPPYSTSALSFCLAPRINAAGRMGLADEALELLLTQDEAQAERLAQRLELYNEERQQTEQQIMAQAMAFLEEQPQRKNDRALVFAGEGWHDGVIGIVASRLLERFGKPVLMVTTNGDDAKGSGRSLPGFHLFEAVHNSAHLMQKYGGHELAAGFSLPSMDVERFREEINQYASEKEMPFPVQKLDMKLQPGSLSPELADAIALLEPFGPGNAQPVFAFKGLTLIAATPLSGGKHLRLTLEQGNLRMNAMAFHTSRDEFSFAAGDIIDIAVALEANEYMGRREVTLIVRGAKFGALPNGELLRAQRLVEKALRRDPLEEAASLLPARDDAANVFRAVKARPGSSPERLLLLLDAKEAYAMARIWLAAEALCELNILETDRHGGYTLTDNPRKMIFEEAGLVRFLSGRYEA